MGSRALFDNTIQALGAAMNFRLMNQKVITSNIANVDTPGYKAKKLEFEDQLRTAVQAAQGGGMKAEDARHYSSSAGGIKDIHGNIVLDPRVSIRNDLNTVDLDEQMAELADNEFQYKAATQMVNKKIALMKYAINEGGF